MRKRTIIIALALVALVGSVYPGLGLAAADTDAALAYLRTQQNADGGFGSGFSPDSGVGSTADAVLAIPDEEFWEAHAAQKRRLVRRVRDRWVDGAKAVADEKEGDWFPRLERMGAFKAY